MSGTHFHRQQHHPSQRQAGSSRLLPWEPRSKLVAGLVAIIILISLKEPAVLGAAFGLGLFFAAGGGIPPRLLGARLLIMAPFLILMSIPLFFGAGLPIAPDRLEMTIQLALKMLTALTLTLFIFYNQPVENMLEALEHLKMPAVVATVIYLAYRYGFLFIADIKTTLLAMQARLFRPRMSRSSLPLYGEVAGGVFIKALNRSDTVSRAMVSRGFRGRLPVSPPRRIGCWGILRVLLLPVFMLGLLILERGVL